MTDTGNRRVLVWDGLPEPGTPPEVVLGQPTAQDRDENRGRLAADSFRWPHDVAGDDRVVFVADAGNHRLLGWRDGATMDRPADTVLGQTDFESATEFPYAPQSELGFRFPYAAAVEDETLAIADTANNRLLVWDRVPLDSEGSGGPRARAAGFHGERRESLGCGRRGHVLLAVRHLPASAPGRRGGFRKQPRDDLEPGPMSERIAERIELRGIVQGVGFRPFVHRLATKLGLDGVVGNDASQVFIEIAGGPGEVDRFVARLEAERPPLARIDEIRRSRSFRDDPERLPHRRQPDVGRRSHADPAGYGGVRGLPARS